METGRNVGHAVDPELVKRLSQAHEIEILLIDSDVSSNGESEHTFSCSMVFLKTETGELFRVEGVIVEQEQEEVYTIDLKAGWLEFSVTENPEGVHLVFGDEYHEFRGTTNLLQYSSICKATGVDVQSRSVRFGQKEREEIVVDEAIVLVSDNGATFISQYVFPYSILITDDPSVIQAKETKYSLKRQ